MHNLILTALLFITAGAHAAECNYSNSPPDAGHAQGSNHIARTWFGGATDRYQHAVLGDTIEAQTLYAQLANTTDCAIEITLNADSVFEDITPRLADVTGDGKDNIIAIESHRNKGASLAIYGVVDGQLKKVASTPHIGTRYRWLAPIGTADFNADDVLDVAYVETPHLAGVIKVWSFRNNKAQLIASKAGYSNHRIGQNYITGGIRNCANSAQMVLPDLHWQQTVVATVSDNSIISKVVADNAAADTINRLLQCE